MRPVMRGDLVTTIGGYYALVVADVGGDQFRVRLANGLVAEVGRDRLTPLPMTVTGPAAGPPANFAEELRPDWADPYSPDYAPPGPPADDA